MGSEQRNALLTIAILVALCSQIIRDLKALSLLHPRYGGEFGESRLEVFDNGGCGEGRHGREVRRVKNREILNQFLRQ